MQRTTRHYVTSAMMKTSAVVTSRRRPTHSEDVRPVVGIMAKGRGSSKSWRQVVAV